MNRPAPKGVERLEFDLTDRLQKSLKISGLKVEELARRLDKSRATLANWTSGRTHMTRNDLLAWAYYTDVPLEWLETGKIPPTGDGPDGGDNLSFLPGSNRRPFHYKRHVVSISDRLAHRSRYIPGVDDLALTA